MDYIEGRGDGIYPVTEEERVRVGDPESPVLPGDINPENAMPYRAGQFAPSAEELTETILRAADDAGLLPNDLPIYDEGGTFSPDLLEQWNPRTSMEGLGVTVDENSPKYVDAVTLSTLNYLGGVHKQAGLTSIVSAPRGSIQGRAYGVIIVAARYSSAGGKFKGALEVYPDFYRYIGIPLSPRLPGQATGVSVASYAIIHAIGHLMFAKLTSTGRLGVISKVLGDDWERDPEVPKSSYEKPNFLGQTVAGNKFWRRRKLAVAVSALAKASPADDFAEAFALYLTNRNYLERVHPTKFDAMSELLE